MRITDVHTGEEFEEYVKNELVRIGITANTTPASNDYGADLIIEYRNHRIAAQCKYYSSPVGISAVQEIIAALSYYHCEKGMVITNSIYTQQAENLAASNGVLLVDGKRLSAYFSNERAVFSDFDYFIEGDSDKRAQVIQGAEWDLSTLVVRYGVSESQVLKRYLNRGLPYYRVGKEYRFDPAEVRQWEIEQQDFSLPAFAEYYEILQRELEDASAHGDSGKVEELQRKLNLMETRSPKRIQSRIMTIIIVIVAFAMLIPVITFLLLMRFL